jgi:group I intron endonuclease
MTGIYQILNLIDGKIYIGQAINCQKRLKNHFEALRKGDHSNLHLQRAFNKYTENNFLGSILKECKKDELNFLECFFIRVYASWKSKFGYNKTLGGDGGNTWICQSEEAKQARSKNWIEKVHKTGKSHKFQKGVPSYMKGKTLSKDEKLRISIGTKKGMEIARKEGKQIGRKFGDVSCQKGKTSITKDNINKYVFDYELESFLSNGWIRGSYQKSHTEHLGTKWMNKNGVRRKIKLEEVNLYLSEGWELGVTSKQTKSELERK